MQLSFWQLQAIRKTRVEKTQFLIVFIMKCRAVEIGFVKVLCISKCLLFSLCVQSEPESTRRICARMLTGFSGVCAKEIGGQRLAMVVQLVLGIIGTIVLLIILIRTRMGLQDRPV